VASKTATFVAVVAVPLTLPFSCPENVVAVIVEVSGLYVTPGPEYIGIDEPDDALENNIGQLLFEPSDVITTLEDVVEDVDVDAFPIKDPVTVPVTFAYISWLNVFIPVMVWFVVSVTNGPIGPVMYDRVSIKLVVPYRLVSAVMFKSVVDNSLYTVPLVIRKSKLSGSSSIFSEFVEGLTTYIPGDVILNGAFVVTPSCPRLAEFTLLVKVMPETFNDIDEVGFVGSGPE
jgi:hypothetical protein